MLAISQRAAGAPLKFVPGTSPPLACGQESRGAVEQLIGAAGCRVRNVVALEERAMSDHIFLSPISVLHAESTSACRGTEW